MVRLEACARVLPLEPLGCSADPSDHVPTPQDDAFAKHVRHASDMETLVGSDASGTEMTEELTGMEDVMAGKATEQTTFLLRSNEALRSEVKELHSQLGLVAEALRGEEGYIGAILGLLQSSDKNCWDIAHMVARSKATARALPSPQDQHSSASWSRAQAHSREQHLSIVPAVAWSSKQVAVGLVAMLSSRNEEQVSGASWAVAELVQVNHSL